MEQAKKQTGIPSRGEKELATGSIPQLFVKFVIPGMLALFLLSAQVFIDGMLVGNFVGANAMAAINLVIPLYSLLIAFAIVMCVGCQCTVGMKLGAGDLKTANDALKTGLVFAVAVSWAAGLVICAAAPALIMLMGANRVLSGDAVAYIRVLALFFPLPVAMFMCDAVVKAMGRPIYATAGMLTMVASNIAFDLLFIVVFGWGVAGAALATGISYALGLCIYLPALLHRHTPVNLFTGRFRKALVGKILYIGSAEGVTELSAAVVTLMFNITLINTVGEKGVAAISAILYLQFVFVALLIGFTSGVAPIFSYNYGAGNRANIHKLFAISARMILSFSLAMLVVAELLDRPMVLIFASKDPVLRDLMIVGFRIIAISVFFTGINIFASGFFTAMNNGRVSALVSILRTLVLEVGALLLMPMWWGINGVWWALPVAEILASLVAVSMLLRYRKT